MRIISSNYDEAKSLANVEPSEWAEPVLMKANVFATLALVDELRAAREPAKAESRSKYVFVIQRTLPGGRASSVAVYTSEDKARSEVQNQNIMSVKQGVDVDWSYETLILNEGD